MRVLKRALAIVYLAAAVVALGTLVCQFWGRIRIALCC